MIVCIKNTHRDDLELQGNDVETKVFYRWRAPHWNKLEIKNNTKLLLTHYVMKFLCKRKNQNVLNIGKLKIYFCYNQ